jgi:hypothetical protein
MTSAPQPLRGRDTDPPRPSRWLQVALLIALLAVIAIALVAFY